MKNLEVLVLHPFEENFRVLNWKVTTTDNVEVAIEKIQTSVFRVLAIHDSLDNTEKLKLKKLVQLLAGNLVIVEFSSSDELEKTVRNGYWNHREINNNIVLHDNSLSFEVKDFS